MTIQEFKRIVWDHYCLIENDFITTFPYVSLDKGNFKTYSDRYFALQQMIGSEIDVVLKEICSLLPSIPGNSLKNICHYCEYISNNLSNFINERVWVYKLSQDIIPWNNWTFSKAPLTKGGFRYSGNNPNWWAAYNSTKHHRCSSSSGKPNYTKANLENVLYSLAGLYVCNLYLFSLLLINNPGYQMCNVALKPSKVFDISTNNSQHTSTFCSTSFAINGVLIPFDAF